MKLKRLSATLSVGVIIGFAVGGIVSFDFVRSNRYVQYDMLRSVFLSFQESLNRWVLWFVVISVVLSVLALVVTVVARLVRKSFRSAAAGIDGQEYLLKFHLVCLVCSIFFFCGGWAINHYWLPSRLHPLSLLGDAGILLLTILMWRVLLKANWGNLIRILKGTASILAVSVLVLNLSIMVEGKVHRPTGPNVILIVVDTLRADHLSCYGYNRNTTPVIDELSEQSVLFRNAISSAPWTTPSVVTAFTSQYPAAVGIEAEPIVLGNEFLTLAEILKGGNYDTKGIVSHILVSSTLGFDQGFNSYDEENARGEDHISSPSITEKAISYIERRGNDKFFLFLHYFDPHHSYILHENYDYYPDYDGALYSGQNVEELRKKAPDMAADDIEFVKALYDSEIAFTDGHIGVLFNKLKDLGLYDDTLIVVTADHGEEFLERGDYWIGHARKLYQEQIHVPLIIKPAGESKQEIMEEYVSLMDLMPTIVDRADLTIPASYRHEGETLRLDAGHQPRDSVIVSETKSFSDLQSLILNGWKLIYDAETDSRELYDLRKDPAEFGNVAMENQELLTEMEAILRDWNDHINSGRSQTDARQPKFTEEQLERLRGLGYAH